MKKLIMAAAGALGAGTAATALGMGSSSADTSNSIYNVLGEPYAKAVAILHATGMSTVFGGSVGSDVPQAQCIVQSQKAITSAKMQLMLNCTEEAQPQRPAATSAAGAPAQSGAQGGAAGGGAPAGGGTRPTPGAPGVVTVAPVPVG